jgi:hypothetical protein
MRAVEEYADHLRHCHEFKCSLNSLMGWSGGITHRQFVVIRRWLHDEWEKPSRTDRYLMRLICIVDNLLVDSKDKLPEEHYRIKLKKNDTEDKPVKKTSSPNRKIPVDPTGETIVVPPCPDVCVSNNPIDQTKPFSQDNPEGDPDEHWKRSEAIWLAAMMGKKK